ncbi:MAG TPA: ornithine carbamoyltransferase [Anaerolineae bacterium]|nr:ornithine carbamoyltransferase [Anaerolineae bacterium]HID85542.1 ornithine carbamoyltransferase [Anaerolineales bacterium]HIQ09638.1 ornithine carbamoyltransferase [Anaerolineaceae bacterium]
MKRDFLAIADFSPAEILDMLDLAVALKKEWQAGGNPPLLAGKSLAMVFQKPSLRTRVSFEMAMQHLGGYAFYLAPQEIGLGKRESIADVARVLSGYVDAIMARVFDHQHVVELARWASVPVINGLSDYNHPCQAMADALTIYERFGRLKGLKVVFVGDGNNVAVSLMHICAKLGADFIWVGPEGYEIPELAVAQAHQFAAESGSRLSFLHDPQQAVQDADVIYTDTWVSMGQEEETQRRLKVFPPYQVNEALVAKTKPSAIVMHCLPAHRGQEITDEVADGPHSVIFQQAHNRLHAQKAILARLFGVR